MQDDSFFSPPIKSLLPTVPVEFTKMDHVKLAKENVKSLEGIYKEAKLKVKENLDPLCQDKLASCAKDIQDQLYVAKLTVKYESFPRIIQIRESDENIGESYKSESDWFHSRNIDAIKAGDLEKRANNRGGSVRP